VEVVDGAGEAAEASGDQSNETAQQQSALPGEGSAPVEKVVAEGATANGPDVEQEEPRPKRADAAAATAEETGSTRPGRVPMPPPRHPRPARPSMEVETERQALSYTTTSLNNGGADRPRSRHGKDKFEEYSHPGFAPDGTPYVGDGTWEERTWKELTRLREDMFWARMGRAH
jgi:hypothetical protein